MLSLLDILGGIMKTLRNKLIGLDLFIWFMTGFYILLDYMKELMALNVEISVLKDFMVTFLIYSILGILLSVLWIVYYKRKSKMPWKIFLFSEIDQLDEDERGLQLDARARSFAANVLILLLLFVAPISMFIFFQNLIPIRLVLIFLALSHTLYQLAYYFRLKYLYKA